MTYSIQDFLEVKTATAAGFNPDASKALVLSNLTGTMQLYRVPVDGGDLRQITDFEEPVTGRYLPTSDDILLVMDEGGNERHQIYLIDELGQDRRNVAYDPEFLHIPGGITRDGKTLAYASNRRNGVDFDVFVHHFSSGDEKSVFEIGGWCQAAGFSPDGRYLAVIRLTDRNSDNDLYLVDLVTEETIHVSPHDDEASFESPQWLPDSSSFFFASDTEREFTSIARYDMKERSWTYVIEEDHDLSCEIDWQGEKLLVIRSEHGFTGVEIRDPASLARIGEIPTPRRGILIGEFSQDGRCFVYSFHSPVDPGDVWLYEFETGKTTRLTNSPNPIPAELFIEPEVRSYSSFDGEEIPVFMFRPVEVSKEPSPVVVTIHGGPESQYMPIFNPVTQFLVHRGYVVVAPNVRGSSGYGKRYIHLDDVYKRLDSVKDLEFLHRWLPSVGLDAKRAVLMGGSYGGYMVLAGLTFQPDLWASGVDIVGISSLVTFLENTSAYRRKAREREYGSLESDREFLAKASPISHIDELKAPLFIIHGANDPRVPLGEAQQIHKILKDKGIETELLIYEDEGHGLQKLKNRLDAYPKVVDFLDRVVGRH